MATEIRTLSSNVYGEQEALLELANAYLMPDSYSTLKSGFLGYMTAGMARVSGEGVWHRDQMYNENFLNTASLPRSIYNFAKKYNYTVGLARPSECRVIIGFYVEDIARLIGASTGILTLPQGQELQFGRTTFMLAGEVNITMLEDNRIAAEYNLNKMDFPTINQSEYIRTYTTSQIVNDAGEQRTVIYIEVRVHQATTSFIDFQVLSSGIGISNNFYEVTIPDGQQLAGFEVLYKEAGDLDFRKLPAYFNENATPTESEYCYYIFNEGSSFEVYFSPMIGEFRPTYNSTLRVRILTTEGASGNFDFTGTPVLSLNSTQRVPTIVEALTQPAGGSDMESLMEVKQGVMRKILERSNIVIESDLDNYLNSAIPRTSVNRSKLTFIKRRDDLQKRLFNAFLMIRDSAGRVVPTNTAALDFEAADLQDRGWSIPPGTLVVYDRAQRIFRLLANNEYPNQMINDPNSFVYSIPFLMRFQVRPFPHLIYYRNQVNIDAALISLPGDVISADSFLANSITIQRNSSFESTYKIDFSVSSSLSAEALAAKCLVRFIVTKEDGTTIGYCEAKHVKGTNIFQALLATDDTFDEENNLKIRDSLWAEGTDTLISAAGLPENVRVKVELYYDMNNTSTTIRYVRRDTRLFHLVNAYMTSENVYFYRNLERVTASEMYVTEAGTFHCDNVPLVGANFFLNPRLSKEVHKVIETYQEAILDIFSLLHNNTTVDVKFYNTYGISRMYNLDRINISLKINIKPKPTIKLTDTTRRKFRDAVNQFVQSCNENDLGRFSISNLTTYLENLFPEIAYIEFVSLNGIPMQNAQQVYTYDVLNNDVKRIPEFINVTVIQNPTMDEDPYVPDVQI